MPVQCCAALLPATEQHLYAHEVPRTTDGDVMSRRKMPEMLWKSGGDRITLSGVTVHVSIHKLAR